MSKNKKEKNEMKQKLINRIEYVCVMAVAAGFGFLNGCLLAQCYIDGLALQYCYWN